MTNIDIDTIRDKLYAKLEPSGWSTVLRHFIYSNDFTNIIQKLAQDSVEGKRFTPSLSKMFSAFYDCPYKDLKVVVIGQDPYPYAGIADGKAFSVQSGTTNVPPSLKFILKEIDDTVYKERRQVDPDLTRWSEQGILLLNIALTTSINKIGQHYLIWQPFLAYLFDMLNWHNPQLIYVYMGKQAQEWADSIDDNYKFLVTHPINPASLHTKRWDSDNIFLKVQLLVQKHYNINIIW